MNPAVLGSGVNGGKVKDDGRVIGSVPTGILRVCLDDDVLAAGRGPRVFASESQFPQNSPIIIERDSNIPVRRVVEGFVVRQRNVPVDLSRRVRKPARERDIPATVNGEDIGGPG